MSGYSFHEGPLPPGFSLDFEPALFNTPEFLLLQAAGQWVSFYALNLDTMKAVASMHVHVEGEKASSPLRAPFGSVDAASEIPPRILYDFLVYAEQQLRVRGVREIVIKNPPRAYDPGLVSLVETFLITLNYTVAIAEPGAVITVDHNDFVQGLRQSQLQRRKQAKNAGLEFRMLSAQDLSDVYSFIANCHAGKGYKISLSLTQLREAVERFSEAYVLSAVMENDTMCAAAVSIKVKSNILYNFLVNHEKRLNSLSPPIVLIEGLYRYCQENEIGVFDLGTSALAGQPNFSLLDFKLRMGAVPTSKLSFYKTLS